MLEQVREVVTALERAVDDLEPEVLDGRVAKRLAELFARVERLGAAGKTLAARRVVATGVWADRGVRSAEQWLARTSGSSVVAAVGLLDAAAHLEGLPATEAALRAGRLSSAQVTDIATAAAVDADAEADLLASAARDGLRGLQSRCRRVRAAAAPEETARRYELIHRGRFVRVYTGRDGAFRGEWSMTPDAGARLMAHLKAEQDQIFREARAAGHYESHEAYAADALVALVERGGVIVGDRSPRSRRPGARVYVRVDRDALVCGRTDAGETCEIAGVGPVPVTVVEEMLCDAILSTVVTDGIDVRAITSPKHTAPASVRAAVIERDRECVAVGCHLDAYLEIDHIVPYPQARATRLEHLARLCRWHHRLRHHGGWHYQRGPDGGWELHPPDQPDDPDDVPCTRGDVDPLSDLDHRHERGERAPPDLVTV